MDLPSDGWRYIIEKRDVPTDPASISSFIFYVRSLNVNQQFGKLRAEFFESLTFNYFRPAKKKEKIVLGFCSQRGSEGDDEHGVGEVEGKGDDEGEGAAEGDEEAHYWLAGNAWAD